MPGKPEMQVKVLEELGEFRIPPNADARIQALMDRNTKGELTQQERHELESWVEMSESVGVLRSRALQALGRTAK